MKILKFLGITLLSLIALFFIIPLFLDTDYTVEKSTTIDANPAEVHAYMKDLSTFNTWSPWSEMDPKMTVKLSGKTGEVGSMYYWNGNNQVGEGSMEITKITPQKIDIRLKFIKPFEAESPTSYTVENVDGKSKVTWYMEGKMDYPWNIFTLFMNMEEQIGKDFDHGLSKLKQIHEAK